VLYPGTSPEKPKENDKNVFFRWGTKETAGKRRGSFYMRRTYDVHTTYIQRTYDVHAAYIRRTYGAHTTCLERRFWLVGVVVVVTVYGLRLRSHKHREIGGPLSTPDTWHVTQPTDWNLTSLAHPPPTTPPRFFVALTQGFRRGWPYTQDACIYF